MKYPVVTIRDAKTSFWPPQIYDTEAAAVRDFAMAVNSGEGKLSYSPGDFTLFKIGMFNNEKGTLEVVHPIEQIVNGLDVYGVKDAK